MLGSIFDLGDEDGDAASFDLWDGATESPAATRIASSAAATIPAAVPSRGESGYVGLSNQGATCYLNSLLQCLYMTREFRAGLYALSLAELEVDPAAPREPVTLQRSVVANSRSSAAPQKPPLKDPTPAFSAAARAKASAAAASAAVPSDATEEEGEVVLESLFDFIDDPLPVAAVAATAPQPQHTSPAASLLPKEKDADADAASPVAVPAASTASAVVAAVERRGRLVPFELQRLFAYLQFSDVASVSTRALTASFGWEGGQAGQQQDVQELNRLLFEEIEAALSGTKEEALISALYRGSLSNQLLCLSCGTLKERLEDFQDVQVGVRGFASLEQSLGAFVTYEHLEGDNQYFCETCGHKVDAKKAVCFAQLPRILVFSLSRFEYDWREDKRVKITTAFSFPDVLDMGPFTRPLEGSSRPSDLVQAPSAASLPPQAEPAIYDLFSVVIHRGGAYGGHYHCLIRETSEDRPARWLDFNDGSVTEVPASAVAKTFAGKNESAYMVTYRRREALPAEALPEMSEIPAEEVLNEVMLNERAISDARAERDRLVHELHLTVCKPEMFALSEDGFALRYANPEAAQEDGPARKTITIDSRKPLEALYNAISAAFGSDATKTKELVLTALSCELGSRNIRAISSASLASAPPDATLDSSGFIRDGTTLLVWDGKDICGRTWDTAKSPISLHLKITTKGGADEFVETREDQLLSSINRAIEAASGIPAAELRYEASGRTLDQDKTVGDLALKHMSRIYVSRQPRPQQTEADAAQPVQQAEEALPVEGMITVFATVTCTNEPVPSIAVHISKKASVADLKSMIVAQIPNPPKEHTVDMCRTLSGGGEGRRFENPSATLEDAGVGDSQRVLLVKGNPDALPVVIPSGVSAGSASVMVKLSHMNDAGTLSYEVALPRQASILECKALVSGLVGLDPSEMRFRKVDFFDMPGEYLNDEEREVQKYHIRDGDRLFVEKGRAPPPGSMFVTVLLAGKGSETQDAVMASKIAALGDCSPLLYINDGTLSEAKLPPNCVQLEDIEVSTGNTLADLKAALVPQMPVSPCTPDRIRVWHRGKLLRKEDTTLKQLHLIEDPTIFVQVLPAPDPLLSPLGGLLLFFHRRNVAQDLYEPAEEVVIATQTPQELYDVVSRMTEIPTEFLRLAAYNPSSSGWRPLDLSAATRKQPPSQPQQQQQKPQQQSQQEGGNPRRAKRAQQHQQQNQASKIVLLVHKPFNLKDGDSISAADLRATPDAASERYSFRDWPPLIRLASVASGVPLEDLVGKPRVRRPEPKLVIKGYARRQYEEELRLRQGTPSSPSSPPTSTSSPPSSSSSTTPTPEAATAPKP